MAKANPTKLAAHARIGMACDRDRHVGVTLQETLRAAPGPKAATLEPSCHEFPLRQRFFPSNITLCQTHLLYIILDTIQSLYYTWSAAVNPSLHQPSLSCIN
jgi:hypothetical protein